MALTSIYSILIQLVPRLTMGDRPATLIVLGTANPFGRWKVRSPTANLLALFRLPLARPQFRLDPSTKGPAHQPR